VNRTTQTLERRLRWLELHDDELREAGASPIELEANRLAIVELQWELARTLLAGPAQRAA
jgi:hypothetical protein